MFKKKLAFRLTAGFVAIVLVSMLTMGLFFIQMFRQYAFESRQETMLARANSIAGVMSGYFQSSGSMRGFGGFMRFLDTLAEANVWITDSKGDPAEISGMGMGRWNTYNNQPLPSEAEDVIRNVLSGQEAVTRSFSSVYNEATITVGVPIFDSEHKVIGSVLLHAPVTGVTDTLYKAAGILLLSLLAALLLASGLGIFYSILFTRPLKAMNRVSREMAKGNYSARTGIQRQDELGQLGSSLDILASKLGTTINQLFQEKGKLSDLVSSISEGLAAFDLDFEPLSINEPLPGIMGRPAPYENNLLKQDFEELGINQHLKTVIEAKKAIQVTRDWMGRKLMFMLSPIIDNQGNVTGSVALIRDISESERLEQLRKDFVANVSHEFRTPLTVIRGSAEAVVDGTICDKEDIIKYNSKIVSEAKALETMVKDLLDLSRLQSGKLEMNIEEVDFKALLDDTVNSIRPIAERKGIGISIKLPGIVPPVPGDYYRLRQLLIIFLDNAIKYSTQDTSIDIDAGIGESLVFTIRDHGYGIPQKDLPFIWDRFYKADRSRGADNAGTGLGLAIAKHIIDLHHGEISVSSEVGKGTAVQITLPLTGAPAKISTDLR